MIDRDTLLSDIAKYTGEPPEEGVRLRADLHEWLMGHPDDDEARGFAEALYMTTSAAEYDRKQRERQEILEYARRYAK